MKRLKLTMVLMLLCIAVIAQDKFFTKNAEVSFHSSTPMEDVDATTNQATTFLDRQTGEIVMAILVNSFHFKRALMEEHFNENYMESTKFPKANFSGKITSPIDWNSSKEVEVDVQGKLTLHGITKDISAKAKLIPGKDKITGTSKFSVKPEDFGIEIPSAVRDKIAKEMEVSLMADYEPYKK
jgi:hypothetical protein